LRFFAQRSSAGGVHRYKDIEQETEAIVAAIARVSTLGFEVAIDYRQLQQGLVWMRSHDEGRTNDDAR
jgi:uncharacterized protein YerC